MNEMGSHFEQRITRLERSLRRARLAASAAGLGLAVLVVAGFARNLANPTDEVRTKRLLVVDDEGRVRVAIGQDPKDTQRRSRAAGLTIFDNTGSERGGFSTMDDGSIVFAMDAPVGVGAPMRDRIGLVVAPDGSSYVMLIDNLTRAVAKLHSDGKGGGGVQVFKWDMNAKQVHIKTLTYDGEQRDTMPMGK
jgi:hypothetical protein